MHVSALFLYPVKSCRRVPLQRALLTPEGLAFDRAWVVVDAQGKIITQREQPRLALVQPSLPAPALEVGAAAASKLPGLALSLEAPGMPTLSVPLQPTDPSAIRSIKVWAWQGGAVDEGDQAAQWLTTYLGVSARLARHAAAAGIAEDTAPAPIAAAAVDGGTADAAGGTGGTADVANGTGGMGGAQPLVRPADEDFTKGVNMRFQDEMPLLVATEDEMLPDAVVATEASLAALSQQVEAEAQPLPMTRFRPNIVIGGVDEPWAEDTWHTLNFGGQGDGQAVQVVLAKPCMRCQTVRIDQEKGQRAGHEPSETLSRIRTGELLGWSHWHKTFKLGHFFGWLAVPMVAAESAGACIAVGDAVAVSNPRPPGEAMAPCVNTAAA